MKIRKRKKILLRKVRDNPSFVNFIKKALRMIGEASQKMSVALHTVYWGDKNEY